MDVGPKAVLRRALYRDGDGGYRVFGNNCEHFVNWCIAGVRTSRQSDDLMATLMKAFSPGDDPDLYELFNGDVGRPVLVYDPR